MSKANNSTAAGTPPLPADFSRPPEDFVKWVKENTLIVTRDTRRRATAHLLHGPVRRGEPVIIHRLETFNHCRRQGWGRKTIQTLVEHAHAVGASELQARCPADSQAAWFFLNIGFHIARRESSESRPPPNRIVLYRYPLNIGDRQPAPQ